MNREIKFRAWDKKNKKFTHWELPKFDGCWDIKFCDVDFNLFTGLKDKNGKEIYEGDIIDGRYGKDTVRYENNWAGFRPFCEVFNAPNPETEVEIIGNIYENPELLTNQ